MHCTKSCTHFITILKINLTCALIDWNYFQLVTLNNHRYFSAFHKNKIPRTTTLDIELVLISPNERSRESSRLSSIKSIDSDDDWLNATVIERSTPQSNQMRMNPNRTIFNLLTCIILVLQMWYIWDVLCVIKTDIKRRVKMESDQALIGVPTSRKS